MPDCKNKVVLMVQCLSLTGSATKFLYACVASHVLFFFWKLEQVHLFSSTDTMTILVVYVHISFYFSLHQCVEMYNRFLEIKFAASQSWKGSSCLAKKHTDFLRSVRNWGILI